MLFKYLKACHTENSKNLFSAAADSRHRSSGLKLKISVGYQETIRSGKSSSSMESMEPRELVGSRLLEVFTVLGDVLEKIFLLLAKGRTR